MRAARTLSLLAVLALPALGLSAHAAPSDARQVALPTTLADAEKELSELDRRLTDADSREKRVGAEMDVLERRSSARARAYARMARAGLLPVAGGFDALVSHAMKIEGARRAIVSDLASVGSLRREHDDLAFARNELSARRSVVAAQRDALAQAQALIAEAADRRQAFERAFDSSSSSGDHIAIYGAGITVHEPSSEPESGFASLRGHLPFPVTGRAEVKSARRESARGPGVELKATTGAAVRSVAAGRVHFSGSYDDYGRVVILDHGDHYFSVYGSLGAVDVRVGDEISSGARIGSVGDGGALYFEIRKGADTIDPKPWLGL